MAYSTPLTAVSNATLTAAQWNASVRDNILETAVAKATAAGQFFVSTAANALAARTPGANSIATTETTTNTSYVDLTTPGPAVTVTTGTVALVVVGAKMSQNTNTAEMYAGFAVSGATTVAAADATADFLEPATAAGTAIRASAVTMVTGLTAGSNVFTMKYRVSAGTGSYGNRHIGVVPF